MEFEIEHAPFAQAVAALMRTTGRTEMYSQVKIEADLDIDVGTVTLATTNGHTFAKHMLYAQVEEPGVEVVPASLLNTLLRGAKADTVRICKGSGKGTGNVTLQAGRVKGSLACYAEASLFPQERRMDNPRIFPILARDLARAIESVSPFALDDAAGQALNRQFVNFWISDSELKTLCTDSHRFGRYRLAMDLDVSPLEFFLVASDAQSIVPFLNALGDAEINVLVDQRSFAIQGDFVELQLALGGSDVRPVDYFQWQTGREDKAEYIIDPKALLVSLQVAMAADSDRGLKVRLTAYPEEILVSASGALGQAEHRAPAEQISYEEEFTVWVLGHYLRDMLRACPTEKMRICMQPLSKVNVKSAAQAHNSVYALSDDGCWDHFLMITVPGTYS